MVGRRQVALVHMDSNDEMVIIRREDIVKEAALWKQSRHIKQWRKRWCVLTPQYLCTFKSEKRYANPTEVIRLRECLTVDNEDKDSFSVETLDQIFHFKAESAMEEEAWIGYISQQRAQIEGTEARLENLTAAIMWHKTKIENSKDEILRLKAEKRMLNAATVGDIESLAGSIVLAENVGGVRTESVKMAREALATLWKTEMTTAAKSEDFEALAESIVQAEKAGVNEKVLKDAKADLVILFEKEMSRAATEKDIEGLAACITHAAKAGVSVKAIEVTKGSQETPWKVCQ